MVKKKYFKKATKKVWLRKWKNISYNYFKVKAEYLDKIFYPDNGGHAIFDRRSGEQVEANKYLLPISAVLGQYAYTNSLSGIFSYYKLLGIRVEIVPDARNQSIPVAAAQPNLMLSYRAGSNVAQTINEIYANNQSIVLNAVQKTVKYFKVYNDSGSYTPTNSFMSGAFTLLGRNQGDGYEQCPSYTIKIALYLLYKYSKA